MARHGTRALGLALVLCVAAGCSARGGGPVPATIGERQQRQRGNISEGVREGDLKRGEAERLRNRQRDIAEQRREAKDDGGISQKERRQIKRRQRKQGEQIYEQRHDDEGR